MRQAEIGTAFGTELRDDAGSTLVVLEYSRIAAGAPYAAPNYAYHRSHDSHNCKIHSVTNGRGPFPHKESSEDDEGDTGPHHDIYGPYLALQMFGDGHVQISYPDVSSVATA
jgi:hypothetical protein